MGIICSCFEAPEYSDEEITHYYDEYSDEESIDFNFYNRFYNFSND